MEILIGADPELFVFDKKQKRFLSGEGMIPGTKENPFPVDKGAIQIDGVALEFNIHPAKSVVEFAGNVRRVLTILEDRVTRINPDYIIKAEPVADFDPRYFDENVSVEAKQLGCTPDYNAYTMQATEPPNGDRPFRTGSGHIHIGWGNSFDTYDEGHFRTCCEVVKMLDLYVGLPSLLWDMDDRRRELYGKFGCFRPKPYGVEYRVLSNKWLSSEHLISYVYQQTRAALQNYIDSGPKDYFRRIENALLYKGSRRVKSVLALLDMFGLPLPSDRETICAY